jgi:hypothetical protein
MISDDLWERVQEIKQSYSSRRGNKRQTKKRLLSGLLKCGCCGGGMTISRGNRYYCSARREKGTCNANRGISVDELETRVLKGLKEILLGNEALVEEFATEFKKELKRLQKSSGAALRSLHKEHQQVERGIKRCLAFIVEGDGDPGLVRDQLRELETRKRELAAELERQSAADVAIHPNLPDLYRRKVNELQQVLSDERTRPQAVVIVRSLIDCVEVHPGRERGHCELVIVGTLAQILVFAHEKTTAGRSRRAGGTFLMVAGARNHLYRTRFLWSLRPHP